MYVVCIEQGRANDGGQSNCCKQRVIDDCVCGYVSPLISPGEQAKMLNIRLTIDGYAVVTKCPVL